MWRKLNGNVKNQDVRDAQLHAVITSNEEEDAVDEVGGEHHHRGAKRRQQQQQQQPTLKQRFLLGEVRDVVEEQAGHIRALERRLMLLRHKRQWGEEEDEEEEGEEEEEEEAFAERVVGEARARAAQADGGETPGIVRGTSKELTTR